ncbi:MAG: deoxyhypusine synthase family protein [Planctomycetes bacterium]|nr:deoxyhypusine synthase family protein [Planctomycetota bacterium]
MADGAPYPARRLHDGREDGLVPLEPLDLDRVQGFAGLLEGMGRTAFGGRNLGEAFEVLKAMSSDPDCLVVATFSGAMTIAKMGRVICSMIDEGLIHCVISTGALMAHGLTEAIGQVHYRHEPGTDDAALFAKGYNRVFDTLEMERNLDSVAAVVSKALEGMHAERPGLPLCSVDLCREVGRILEDQDEGPGVLRSAWRKGVPVFIPAFTDSEVGLDLATWWMGRERRAGRLGEGKACFDVQPPFNPYLDLCAYARLVVGRRRLGIFTVGGGVPRNWAQQVAPFADLVVHRVGVDLPVPRFRYAVRICPDPPYWGGLSGCTYSEGVSWGKFVPPEEGGRFAEVYSDATLVWPLLVKGLLEWRRARAGEPRGG